jgi:hypothetical protein
MYNDLSELGGTSTSFIVVSVSFGLQHLKTLAIKKPLNEGLSLVLHNLQHSRAFVSRKP